ncbi:MAG: AAA family ATPase, partial [Candidatus Eisenbacteria bacterium]|nr:AAA family ATPase [Candidatus Eisenbacteria bacterium]
MRIRRVSRQVKKRSSAPSASSISSKKKTASRMTQDSSITAKKEPSAPASTPEKKGTGSAKKKQTAKSTKPPRKQGPSKKSKVRRQNPSTSENKPDGTTAPDAVTFAQARPARRANLSSREAHVLLNLESLLHQRIVGKDEAVRRVANTIRTRRANLDFRPDRPDGAFLLVGPAGVGKNEFAHAVAEVLLGDENQVVSLDMNDYQEEESIANLMATPVLGRDDLILVGTLTSAVRANPNIVILFRGLEKAHYAVQRLIYQILEEGTFTDAAGQI